jgi:hypothetical protein
MRTGFSLTFLAICFLATGAAAEHNHAATITTRITGAAIRDDTAQRLYFVSLSNMDSKTLESHLIFNLGLRAADLAAASQVVTEFKTQYNDEVRIYNDSLATGFTESKLGNFHTRRAMATSDALANAERTLSVPAFKTLQADIQKAKNKMFVGVATGATSSMGCCYNMVQNDVITVESDSPFHFKLTHQVLIEGHVTVSIPPGPMHQGQVFTSVAGHKNDTYGPEVTPNSYLQVSTSVALDSNTDACLTDDTGCTGDDNGDVICTEAGEVAFFELVLPQLGTGYTLVENQSSPAGYDCSTNNGITICDFLVTPSCTNTPQWAPQIVEDGPPAQAGWYSPYVCERGNSSQPWGCLPIPGAATKTPNTGPVYCPFYVITP